MKGDFLLKSIDHDPRYVAFLKKMRLPGVTERKRIDPRIAIVLESE